jgi:hypothetical protein
VELVKSRSVNKVVVDGKKVIRSQIAPPPPAEESPDGVGGVHNPNDVSRPALPKLPT